MTRFERVIQILDLAVGGPTAPIGFHGAFWRGLTRNEFVAKKVIGLDLIAVGNGAGSNLVRALKGEPPFGADLPNPPQDATISRMPSGLEPVSPADIAFIEKWIDEGCLEDEVVAAQPLRWRRTNAPTASSRTDDIWFLDPNIGWAVNSDGQILKTTDGFRTFVVQHTAPGVYMRCVGFADALTGWVGTFTPARRLLHTKDGGNTWDPVANLPAGAPVIVCGISVVSNRVVYASGTNRPADKARMVKTLDGGRTWTALDMTSHASILIDTYFTDESHGWVVGGKTDVPNPTTRDQMKPVVLETFDGGSTWVNRLAGQEADFPFGEWGWKIQFLNRNLGFISLENFRAGAILKTTDGGASWKRLKINDPQGNANIEGIGFIDENNGWVGGWGSSVRPLPGFSSGTTDGGNSWQDANHIGLFLNRFRFFGSPVSVGYASGDTIYKYSADPVESTAVHLAATAGRRPLLPQAQILSDGLPIYIPMDVPAGTKRLTLHVWDRFGVDIGNVLDDIRPQSGSRRYAWDGRNADGDIVPAGTYIIRLTADDAVASSILTHQASPRPLAAAAALSRTRFAAPALSPGRPTTIAALMRQAAPNRDMQWLKDALQIAIQLELATLPPYLTARWTIVDRQDPVAQSIFQVRREEMLHFGIACNLSVAIGGSPVIADAGIVPTYPGHLPGGVLPNVEIRLKRLSRDQAGVFMQIEYPQGGPIAFAAASETFDSIGEFYSAIFAAFQMHNPSLDTRFQLQHPSLGLSKIDTLDKVRTAIELIKIQGEGSKLTPEEKPGDLAHYYRFGEIYHQKQFVKDAATGKWGFSGPAMPLPQVWPMADIPVGGYQRADVADPATWDLIATFDDQYSQMLRALQSAWQQGDPVLLRQAIGLMLAMGDTGAKLVQIPIPGRGENYGPCFRYVAPSP